jgi:3-oxoacyl-[acyl-carrier protein] reductase
MTTRGVVLVTGGSRGIGRAVSERFLREGWLVAVNYRSDDASAAEVVRMYGASCRTYRCDVTDEAAVADMVGRIENDFGPIDVLVNNAGYWRGGPVHKVSAEDFLSVLSVTLVGAKNCVSAVAPHMADRSFGHIINVSSAVGMIGWKGDSAYAAAKAGLIGFTRAIAKELAEAGIRVNVVLPGFVETDMTIGISARQREQLQHRTLLGSVGRPEDIASMIYAIAIEGAYMTGSVVTVDGGLVLGRDEPLPHTPLATAAAPAAVPPTPSSTEEKH